jgi:DNA-binding GntR family transcriptional regulator
VLDQRAGKTGRRLQGPGSAPDGLVSVAPVSRMTLAEELRLQLADEIVRGVLAPGLGLDETELARRFGVSRTPVREAIRLLAAGGLVDARPHRGAVVARPSTERIVGMFEALKELEGLCSGLAAERMTGAERRGLERLHDELAALVRAGDPQRYYEVNLTFHMAIYAGSHNDYLAELTEATRARIAPFSRAQFRGLGRLPRSHGEHHVVIEAILRGDRDGAAASMRDHIETVREAYVDYSDSF